MSVVYLEIISNFSFLVEQVMTQKNSLDIYYRVLEKNNAISGAAQPRNIIK